LILKEKAIRLAKRILAKQNDGDDKNGEEEADELDENATADVEEFLSGFGFFPDAIESSEIDSKTDEIEAQGACISQQGEGGSIQEEEIDTAGT